MIDIRPDSRGNRFRAARLAYLQSIITRVLENQPRCRIIDVGGTLNFWSTWSKEIDWATTEIVCANMDPLHASEDLPAVKMIKADARDLRTISNNEFDVAFSNSVIEHVGRWHDMVAMASEVKRIAARYLVQTPNYWFPIEPHARTPFLHWLPEPIAYRIVMARRCGYWGKANTVAQAVELVQSAHMIDFAQMAELFSDATIIRERSFGLTKSLMAIKI